MSDVFGGSDEIWLVHEPAISQVRSATPSPSWSTVPTTSPPHVPSSSQTSGALQALSESSTAQNPSVRQRVTVSIVVKRSRFRLSTTHTNPFDSNAFDLSCWQEL